jgi:hypothetical protein
LSDFARFRWKASNVLNHTQDLAGQLCVAQHGKPQLPRERQHPLAHGCTGKDIIDEVSRTLGSAATRATWTHRSAFARKCHKHLVGAVATANPRKAMRIHTTTQEIAELSLDKRLYTQAIFAAFSGGLQKRFKMVTHGVMQRRRRCVAWRIARAGFHRFCLLGTMIFAVPGVPASQLALVAGRSRRGDPWCVAVVRSNVDAGPNAMVASPRALMIVDDEGNLVIAAGGEGTVGTDRYQCLTSIAARAEGYVVSRPRSSNATRRFPPKSRWCSRRRRTTNPW